MDDLKQIFEAEITLYQGQKISVIDKGFGYMLRFKLPDGYYAELDCRIVMLNKKTLSSNKPKKVVIKSYQKVNDIEYVIRIKDAFTISDVESRVGKGRITDIFMQQ